jgi:hypothetical protein
MNGYEFEDYVSGLLKKMGFIAEQTTYSNDGGIDIVAFYDRPIFYGKYIIQCKNWQGTVGAPEIRDLYGVVTDQRANKGIIITPSDFTEQAYEFVKGKNIELINGTVLNALVNEYLGEEIIEQNAKQDNLPENFNNERYEYLVKKISDDYKNSERYKEMKMFLRQYIKNEESGSYYAEVINRLIQNQDSLIQKCYNTKGKISFKRAALREKANYLLLVGKLDEALELILDTGNLFIYKEAKSLAQHNDCYEISNAIGGDVLTRNLYMIFKAILYSNGMKVIEGLNKHELPRDVRISIKRNDTKLQSELTEYQEWDDNKIYVVDFRVEKNRHNGPGHVIMPFSAFDVVKIWIDAGVVRENFYGNLNDDYYKRLDKVFLQHGYEIS